MSGYGYPHNQPGPAYGYGAPPPPSDHTPTAQPYAAPPPYGAPPPSSAPPYGGKPDKPPKDNHPPYGSDYHHSYSGQPSAPPSHPGSGYPSAPPSHPGSGYPSAPPSSHPGPGYQSGSPSHPGSGYPSAPPSSHPGSGYQSGSHHGSGYQSAPPSSHPGSGYPSAGPGYASPFSALMPSTFPPGTDPTVVACFQIADTDGSGQIDDKELQKALSSYNQSFSLRTVHLLMVHFTASNSRKIGPKEFTALFYGLQSWREIFERFDKDRSGKIDAVELRDALYSLGFAVSPAILDLLVSKYDRTGGKSKAVEYDNFIECCLTVKGLTEKFKEKDSQYRGSATFTYEEFMLTVLPYLVA
ncbi:hypothetical protein RND81_14G037800 [Saponaria officinalis]|uniref:EF-hand domain-containing protein n=1 Tax=Saponaria officinalis TaxID=3572 RepID=A0AAW1GLI9_SAPOF